MEAHERQKYSRSWLGVRHLRVRANVCGGSGEGGGRWRVCRARACRELTWREKTVSAGSLVREPAGSVRARRRPRRQCSPSMEAKSTRHQDRHIWPWGSDVRCDLNSEGQINQNSRTSGEDGGCGSPGLISHLILTRVYITHPRGCQAQLDYLQRQGVKFPQHQAAG